MRRNIAVMSLVIVALTGYRGTSVDAAVVHAVPATIAGDCSTDATASINSWIQSVPDGSTLVFHPGACYRVDGALQLVDRHDLVINGLGATFKAVAKGDLWRDQWAIIGGNNITLKNMTAQGVNPAPKYDPRYEGQHNFQIYGAANITLDNVHGKNAHGDFVGVDPDGRVTPVIPARNITVRNSTANIVGRMTVFCGYCDGLTVDNNVFSGNGYDVIDLETEYDYGYNRNIRITNNVINDLRYAFVASIPASNDVRNVVISGNFMNDYPLTCWQPVHIERHPHVTSGKLPGPFLIENNRFKALGDGVWLSHADNVTVRGNTIDYRPMGCDALSGVRAYNSDGGSITGNDVTGAEAIATLDDASTNWIVCGNKISDDGTYTSPEPCPDVAPRRTLTRVGRLGGPTRVETAVAVSRHLHASAEAVVVARSDRYADALAAGPLGARLHAPVLLNSAHALDRAVASEVQRLGARQVVLVGGDQALSPRVETSLRTMGLTTRRIAGSNRFDTARLIARELPAYHDVFVAEGANSDTRRGWPDALSASGLASMLTRPVLLVEHGRLPPETAAALPSGGIATIIGGSSAVSERVEAAIATRVGSVRRIAGADRYATSLAVAQEVGRRGITTERVLLARGRNWPDGLAAGAAAGTGDGVLVLVRGDLHIDSEAASQWLFERSKEVTEILLVGGPAALGSTLEESVRERMSS